MSKLDRESPALEAVHSYLTAEALLAVDRMSFVELSV